MSFIILEYILFPYLELPSSVALPWAIPSLIYSSIRLFTVNYFISVVLFKKYLCALYKSWFKNLILTAEEENSAQRAGIADGGGLEFRPPGTTAD